MRLQRFSSAQLRPLLFPAWLGALGLLVLSGLAGGLVVFTRGLVVTNLSDVVPWGLWITVDLSSIAVSAGAFALSAAVQLLGLKRFAGLARTAVFIGFIGYSMAVLTLLLDIGRPDRFWHALAFWNPHSVLWEITMAIALYFAVLAMEVAPLIGESAWFQRRWPRLGHLLAKAHTLAPMLAVAGLGLSLLHQSSLGAAYGVLKARPVWHKPDLAILFILSALAGGLSLTLLATVVVSKLRKGTRLDRGVVDELARFIPIVLLAYLYLKFWDALAVTYTYLPGRNEGLSLLTSGPLSFNFWVGEIGLGILLPVFILLTPRLRADDRLLMLATALVVGGVVAYRWDVNLAGLMAVVSIVPLDSVTRYASYSPSIIEWITAAGVAAYGLMAFTLGARYLNVVDHDAHDEVTEKAEAEVVELAEAG